MHAQRSHPLEFFRVLLPRWLPWFHLLYQTLMLDLRGDLSFVEVFGFLRIIYETGYGCISLTGFLGEEYRIQVYFTHGQGDEPKHICSDKQK